MMKKVLYSLLLLLVASSFMAQAQGNLQFNQVITINGTLSNTASYTNQNVVPANKVWKIEKVITAGNGVYLVVNGTTLVLTTYDTGQAIWLKAGDTVQFKGSGAGNYGYLLSILEFNIVP
jgi:hypothetical protein